VSRPARRATPSERARVVVVAKRTAYRRFIVDERDPRAKALLRRHDPAVKNWIDAHQEHMRTLDAVLTALTRRGAQVMLVERSHAAFDPSDATLVVAVGGDGTLLAASQRGTFPRMLDQALAGKLANVELTRMAVAVNGRLRSKHVLNEALFCHASPAATSRYLLEHRRASEEQRSSGIWIGPAAGSTAAQRSAGGRVLPLGSPVLQLVVREPYTPSGRPCRMAKLLIEEGDEVRLESKMDDAALFFDGPYRSVPVRLGDKVSFFASNEPLVVLGLKNRR